ncbi:leucine-rich repeat domain-containing protein [Blastopirellula marina]|nr:hypothetical protein [Blastopirellula marina]
MSTRTRTAILASMALLICALGTAWGYQSFFSGRYGAERKAVSALKRLAMVEVEYDDQGAVVELRANSARMTDNAASHLVMLQSLQRLNLNQSGVTDKSLEIMGALPELRSLYLERTAVTSAGVAALASCEKLEELMLTECAIQDDALETIGQLPALTLLSLSETPITDAGMFHLQSLPHLKTLYLRDTAVTGEGFAMLKSSTDLRLIDLSDNSINRSTIETLRSFPNLERLYLGRTSLTDELLPEFIDTLIRFNPHLRGLAIMEVPITDNSLTPLKRLAELPDLAVVDFRETGVTRGAFQELIKATPEVNFSAHYPVE